jgi:hypothetical protein
MKYKIVTGFKVIHSHRNKVTKSTDLPGFKLIHDGYSYVTSYPDVPKIHAKKNSQNDNLRISWKCSRPKCKVIGHSTGHE